MRFKLALTEDEPQIRPYDEVKWAELPDANMDDLTVSIKLIEAIHAKWGLVLRGLTRVDLNRTYIHPEHGKIFNLAETIGSYAWHCRHHLAHIELAIASNGRYN